MLSEELPELWEKLDGRLQRHSEAVVEAFHFSVAAFPSVRLAEAEVAGSSALDLEAHAANFHSSFFLHSALKLPSSVPGCNSVHC